MPYRYSSSLHGLQYITEDGRHWTERILWIFLCLLGFILTIYFLLPIWRKWEEQVSRQNEKDCTLLQLLRMQACLERLRDFFFDTFPTISYNWFAFKFAWLRTTLGLSVKLVYNPIFRRVVYLLVQAFFEQNSKKLKKFQTQGQFFLKKKLNVFA